MKQNRKWRVFLLSGLLMVTMVGCTDNKQKVEEVISKEPIEQSVKEESHNDKNVMNTIYNDAFETYNDITELAVIINNPTKEELSHIDNLGAYGEDKGESMLIIPKYNGSKITVSTAEYTGEQYIAKDDLFVNESTPDGYGLHLYAKRPAIPEMTITISYQNANYCYVVTSNGKDGNNRIEHVRVETDKGSTKQGEMIAPTEEKDYTKGLSLFDGFEVDVDNDGENESVEVYCDGMIDPNGEYQLDDGQNWTMILRKGDAIYPLFDKAYIQFGKLQYAVYQDGNEYDKTHILIECKSGAAVYYYDCTYDEETGNMLRNNFFDASNINMLKTW